MNTYPTTVTLYSRDEGLDPLKVTVQEENGIVVIRAEDVEIHLVRSYATRGPRAYTYGFADGHVSYSSRVLDVAKRPVDWSGIALDEV